MMPDFMALYEDYNNFDKSRQNLLKRAVLPEDLLEIPVFYDIYRKHLKMPEQRPGLLRLIYCLPHISHLVDGKSLGAALSVKGPDGQSKISEKRIIQVSRMEDKSQAMRQLRRILKQAEPVLDWNKAAATIWYWGKTSRRQLLEDYFLDQPSKTDNR